MKVVIDTNVLVSAAWRDKSPEAVVIWIAFHDNWDWMVSQEILDEYRRVEEILAEESARRLT